MIGFPDDPETDVDNDADDDVDTAEPDLARAALQDAQVLARRRGGRRGSRRSRDQGAATDGRQRPAGYSAAGPDPERDPQRLGDLVPGVVADMGWGQAMSDARVFADWAGLVGRDVAAHCTPQSLRAGELRIAAESTAWATQLQLLAGVLLARLAGELGPNTVTKVIITGPVGRGPALGRLRVPGSRGPRDTYG